MAGYVTLCGMSLCMRLCVTVSVGVIVYRHLYFCVNATVFVCDITVAIVCPYICVIGCEFVCET